MLGMRRGRSGSARAHLAAGPALLPELDVGDVARVAEAHWITGGDTAPNPMHTKKPNQNTHIEVGLGEGLGHGDRPKASAFDGVLQKK